jgi:hypothetical protein
MPTAVEHVVGGCGFTKRPLEFGLMPTETDEGGCETSQASLAATTTGIGDRSVGMANCATTGRLLTGSVRTPRPLTAELPEIKSQDQ